MNEQSRLQPLDIDFSIGMTDCTHVDGIPTLRQHSTRSALLNRPEFLPIKDVLSESFQAKLKQEFPKALNNWQVKVITGENFNMQQILQPWQVPLKSAEFVVFVFKSFDSDTAGDSKLFQCKYGGLCHKLTPNLSKFMDHMRTHTKERPFKCTYPGCGKAFSQKTNVKQHIKEVH